MVLLNVRDQVIIGVLGAPDRTILSDKVSPATMLTVSSRSEQVVAVAPATVQVIAPGVPFCTTVRVNVPTSSAVPCPCVRSGNASIVLLTIEARVA